MEFLKEYYPWNDILLVYECGSNVYDVKTDNSDSDYIVVISDYNGMEHITDEMSGREYNVFGVKQWISKMEFKYLSSNFLAYNEEVLALDKTLIHLDPSFEDTYCKYKNRDFKDVLHLWLLNVVDYYSYYLGMEAYVKPLYHLFGISSLLKKFEETGSFILPVDDDTKAKMLEYKNSDDRKKYKRELEEIYRYIKKKSLE